MQLAFEKKINELQKESIERLRKTLEWSHYANVVVRKDGQDIVFEADWLRDALNVLCGKNGA